MTAPVLSVVIPAYNEEDNLAATVCALHGELTREAIPHEILLVNDNSMDGTSRVMEELAGEIPEVRPIHRHPPGGFGRAVRTGLEQITGEMVVIYMADQSDHPADAVAYYRKLCEGYDCVFGSRFIKGSRVEQYPTFKYAVNRIVNRTIQILFRCPFNDLTNAFKAYRSEVIRACGPFRSSHFNITIEMSLSALNCRYQIAQIPISWTGRTWGSSNLRLGEMGRRYMSTLIKMLADRFLVSDDIIAERLAKRAQDHDRIENLEERVTSLESGRMLKLGEEALPGSEEGVPEAQTATAFGEGGRGPELPG